MKIHRWLLATLLFLTPLLQAGTPDNLMWGGKDQDALILGEVLELTSADTCTVKVMAVFPQTKEWFLHEGQTITVGDVKSIELRLNGIINGNKYLMSLQRENDQYRPAWGLYALSPGSSNFANARMIDPYHPIQFMISTGGKYPLPSYVFPEPPEAVENTQIPADLLKQIPTRELIEIWLEYPHLHLVHSSKTLQGGMDKLRTTFNGLPELLQRDDVADVLFGVFREKNLDNLTIKPPENDADKQLANQHAALALLLAQPEIQERLSFYQRWYLHWQVEERLEAMTETWLGSKPAFICYRALATALVLT